MGFARVWQTAADAVFWRAAGLKGARSSLPNKVGRTGLMATAIIGLKNRSDFLACARGRRVHRPALVLQGRRRQPGENGDQIRYGLTATKKLGNAVVRNRIRRRLRAAAQEVLPEKAIAGWDYVLIGRVGALKCPFGDLLRDLETALEMLQKARQPGKGRANE